MANPWGVRLWGARADASQGSGRPASLDQTPAWALAPDRRDYQWAPDTHLWPPLPRSAHLPRLTHPHRGQGRCGQSRHLAQSPLRAPCLGPRYPLPRLTHYLASHVQGGVTRRAGVGFPNAPSSAHPPRRYAAPLGKEVETTQALPLLHIGNHKVLLGLLPRQRHRLPIPSLRAEVCKTLLAVALPPVSFSLLGNQDLLPRRDGPAGSGLWGEAPGR